MITLKYCFTADILSLLLFLSCCVFISVVVSRTDAAPLLCFSVIGISFFLVLQLFLMCFWWLHAVSPILQNYLYHDTIITVGSISYALYHVPATHNWCSVSLWMCCVFSGLCRVLCTVLCAAVKTTATGPNR